VADINNYFTLDDINDVIETFEDFLERYSTRILASDEELADNGETPYTNDARIYGTVYGDLQGSLLELFERKALAGKVKPVVKSWESEVEEWMVEK